MASAIPVLPKDTPLTDAQVSSLGDAGFKEGDHVPGYGVLLPDGTFKSDGGVTQNASSSTSSSSSSSTTKLSYADSSGIIHNADGTLAPAPAGAQKSANGNWYLNGIAYGAPPASSSGAVNPYVTSGASDGSYMAEWQKAEDAKIAAARGQIEGQFSGLIKDEQQRGVSDTASRAGQLARVGGGAPDTRFSSAAAGFIDAARIASEKRVATLQVQKMTALSSLDLKAADELQAEISKERDRADTLSQKSFDNLMKTLGYNLDVKTGERAQDTLDLSTIKTLNDLPSGKTITIGDKTYTGIGASGDVKMYQTEVEVNGVRQQKVFGINSLTGEKVFENTLGRGVTPSGSDNNGRFTGSNIPAPTMSALAEMVQGVVNGDYTNADVYSAFPDVSPSFINSLISPTLKYGP